MLRAPFLVIVALLVSLVAGPLAAQEGYPALPKFSVQKLHPSASYGAMITLDTAPVLPHLGFSAGLFTSYGSNPLVFVNPERVEVVGGMLATDLLFSLGILRYLEITLDVPFYPLISGDGEAILGVPDTPKSLSTGDVSVAAKVSLLRRSGEQGFGLAFVLPLIVPSSREGSLMGEASLGFAPRLVMDVEVSRLTLALNVGYLLREEQSLGFLEVDDELFGTFGVAIDLYQESVIVMGEVSVATPAAAPFQDNNNLYTEGIGALKYITDFGLGFMVGGGGSLGTAGYGNVTYRVFGAITYSPRKVAPPDADGDGVIDDLDKCPELLEDHDGFEDTDGCPEDDNDLDGFPDEMDSCPDSAEDMDGVDDADGCPEPDEDGDGICDPIIEEKGRSEEFAEVCMGSDTCPSDAEDEDGFEDLDGCPEPDNDGDLICDAWVATEGKLDEFASLCKGSDSCPDEKETINLFEDEDGCPDKVDKVQISGDHIVIPDKIYFKKGKSKIQSKSYQLLSQIAKVLRDNPQILKLEIQGHTDSSGSAKGNKRLSKKRAKEVYKWLVKKGKIKKKRLSYKGYGEEQPLTTNDTDEGKQINRRVEFKILKMKAAPKPKEEPTKPPTPSGTLGGPTLEKKVEATTKDDGATAAETPAKKSDTK